MMRLHSVNWTKNNSNKGREGETGKCAQDVDNVGEHLTKSYLYEEPPER